MSLRELPLEPQYESSRRHLLTDFYVPCLGRSVLYQRAVGFFTSTSLNVAARGIVGLIRNGGSMQLICSPILSNDDIREIASGYEQRKTFVESRLLKGLEDISDPIVEERIANLAWLIANRRLEVKIVIPKSVEDKAKYAMYHAKIGIFQDSNGDYVAFAGSPNETAEGLVYNYELIDVYLSWNQTDALRAEAKRRTFENLWRNWTPGLEVVSFPEAVERKLLRFKREAPSLKEPEGEGRTISMAQQFSLRDYQQEAINAWSDNDCHGIVAMATGSGKTLVALRGVKELVPFDVVTVIAVPSENLVGQWLEVLQVEFPNAQVVLAYSGNQNWRTDLDNLLKYAMGLKRDGDETTQARAFIISVLRTASGIDFQGMISRRNMASRTCLIVDEVHMAGAPEARHIFDFDTKWRLGLSATPERDWDPEGTKIIMDFFGGIVYEFPFELALSKGILSPYNYFVKPIELTPVEMKEFKEITERIGRKLSQAVKMFPRLAGRDVKQVLIEIGSISEAQPMARELQTLIIKRVQILKDASKKAEALKTIFETQDLKKCIVYCNDIDHVSESLDILHSLNVNAREYDSEMTRDERHMILDGFSKGDFSCIVAVRCLDQGVDIPDADSAVLVASSRSTREFIQRRGRLLRKHKSKSFSSIFDILVMPFSEKGNGFPLNDAEYWAFSQEITRARIFGKGALNANEVSLTLDVIQEGLDSWKT